MAAADFKRSCYCNFMVCTVLMLFVNNVRCDSISTDILSTDETIGSTSTDNTINISMEMTSTIIVSDSDTSSAFVGIMPTSSAIDTGTAGNEFSSSVINPITQIDSSSMENIESSSSSSYVESVTMPYSLNSSISSTEDLQSSSVSNEINSTFDVFSSTTVDDSMTSSIVMDVSNTLSGDIPSQSMPASTNDIVVVTTSGVNDISTSANIAESTTESYNTQTTEQTSNLMDITSSIGTASLNPSTSDNQTSSVYTSSTPSSMYITSPTPSSMYITSSTISTIYVETTSLTISPSSVEITSPSISTSSVAPSSSIAPSTTPTTTKNPTTTPVPEIVTPSIDENTVYNVDTKIILVTCKTNNYELRLFLWDILKDIEGFKDVIIIENTCGGQKRKKRDTSQNVVDTQIVLLAKTVDDNKTLLINDIVEAFNTSVNASIENESAFKTKASSIVSNICKSSICDQYHGYDCHRRPDNTAECISKCNKVECSGHGKCRVFVESIGTYGKKCVCDSEEFYKYEGDECQTKRMKWELAVAIAGGAGGAIILILLFILCLCCCCKRNDDKFDNYDRRRSYEPMSDVLNRPAYYRNEGIKSQTGFSNFGYDDESYNGVDARPLRQTNGQSWNPEDSKDTYAKIQEKLEQEKSFQIKRPQLSTTSQRQSDPGEAATGF